MDLIIYIVYILFFLALGYGVGSALEKSHYGNIQKREKDYLTLPAVTSKKIEEQDNIVSAQLVTGSVVVSLDYFKRFLAGLRNIVGGRVKSYETILDRGRREAVLRMKEQARVLNADMIINMRFQTSGIGQITKKKGAIGCFEVLAYGTAVTLKEK